MKHISKGCFALYGTASSARAAFTVSLRRMMSTRPGSTVDLEYDKLVPPNGNATDNALVIMHGLL
jgi:hypothetical protein